MSYKKPISLILLLTFLCTSLGQNFVFALRAPNGLSVKKNVYKQQAGVYLFCSLNLEKIKITPQIFDVFKALINGEEILIIKLDVKMVQLLSRLKENGIVEQDINKNVYRLPKNPEWKQMVTMALEEKLAAVTDFETEPEDKIDSLLDRTFTHLKHKMQNKAERALGNLAKAKIYGQAIKILEILIQTNFNLSKEKFFTINDLQAKFEVGSRVQIGVWLNRFADLGILVQRKWLNENRYMFNPYLDKTAVINLINIKIAEQRQKNESSDRKDGKKDDEVGGISASLMFLTNWVRVLTGKNSLSYREYAHQAWRTENLLVWGSVFLAILGGSFLLGGPAFLSFFASSLTTLEIAGWVKFVSIGAWGLIFYGSHYSKETPAVNRYWAGLIFFGVALTHLLPISLLGVFIVSFAIHWGINRYAQAKITEFFELQLAKALNQTNLRQELSQEERNKILANFPRHLLSDANTAELEDFLNDFFNLKLFVSGGLIENINKKYFEPYGYIIVFFSGRIGLYKAEKIEAHQIVTKEGIVSVNVYLLSDVTSAEARKTTDGKGYLGLTTDGSIYFMKDSFREEAKYYFNYVQKIKQMPSDELTPIKKMHLKIWADASEEEILKDIIDRVGVHEARHAINVIRNPVHATGPGKLDEEQSAMFTELSAADNPFYSIIEFANFIRGDLSKGKLSVVVSEPVRAYQNIPVQERDIHVIAAKKVMEDILKILNPDFYNKLRTISSWEDVDNVLEELSKHSESEIREAAQKCHQSLRGYPAIEGPLLRLRPIRKPELVNQWPVLKVKPAKILDISPVFDESI
ncbi:MAG: hypothetical protein ABII74_01425 [Elusimicrobiota bacterium]